MASPDVFQFLEHASKHGYGDTLRALEDRDLANALLEQQSRYYEEQTNDRVANRDMTARKLAAETELAELTTNLSQTYLDRQMRGKAEAAEREAQIAQLSLEQEQLFGLQTAQAAATKAEFEAKTAKEEYNNIPNKQEYLAAMTAAQKQATANARLEAESYRRKAEQDANAQRALDFANKQRTIYSTLSSFDLTDPKQVDIAASMIASKPGIKIDEQDIQNIRQFPQESLNLARRYSLTPEQVARNEAEQVRSTNKLNEIAAEGIEERRLEELKQRAPKAPGKEFTLPSHIADRTTEDTVLDLAQSTFGDSSIVVPGSSSYNADIATELKIISKRIVGKAEAMSDNLTETRANVEEFKKDISSTFNAALVLHNNDMEAAWQATPKDFDAIYALQDSLDRAITDPNSTEGRVLATYLKRPDLIDHQDSLKNYGIGKGLNPLVVDYLMGMAALANEQKDTTTQTTTPPEQE